MLKQDIFFFSITWASLIVANASVLRKKILKVRLDRAVWGAKPPPKRGSGGKAPSLGSFVFNLYIDAPLTDIADR